MDVDGTLTDGQIYVSEKGEFFKAFNVKDGYGIKNILKLNNIISVIVTARNSDIVRFRAQELDIDELFLGVSDKLSVVENLLRKYDFTFENVAYIGDDLNDLSVIKKAHLSFAPYDAVDEVKTNVNIVLSNKGGQGAVRECIEQIMIHNAKS